MQRTPADSKAKLKAGRPDKRTIEKHMKHARAIARDGLCLSWNDVLRDFHKKDADGAFVLHLWAGATARDEIDRLCREARLARKFK